MNARRSIQLPAPAPAPHVSVIEPHPLMNALRRGLPITLLVDLLDPNGPRSHEMFEREGHPNATRADADLLVLPDADLLVLPDAQTRVG